MSAGRNDRRRPGRDEDAGRRPRPRVRGPLGEPRGLDRPDRGRAGRAAGARDRARRARRAPGVAAVGLGHPGDDRPRQRHRGLRRQPADRRTCRSAIWSASAPACRSSSTTTPTSPPSPSTSTAPPAGADNAVMLTIGTGIGGGLILGGEIYRGATGAGAELGHTVIACRRAALPGQLPGPRLRRDATPRARRSAARARAAAEREPDSALGAMLADGRDDRRQGGHRGGARRRPDRDRRLRPDRLPPRRRPDQLRQHLRARGVRDRRRRDRRRRPAARAGAPGAARRGRCRR